jgi:hypothetical protein
MPEWMATRILALLLGLSGGFRAHYTLVYRRGNKPALGLLGTWQTRRGASMSAKSSRRVRWMARTDEAIWPVASSVKPSNRNLTPKFDSAHTVLGAIG